jgi:hypothetical protein
MTELSFDCVDVQVDSHAAMPTLLFKLAVAETTGTRVHALALRVQIRIEPQRRRYTAAEEAALTDLFGTPDRWAETVHPMQFAFVSHVAPGFTGSTHIDLPVPLSYDLEVAAGRYFAALGDGEIPMLLLFSGTVFTRGEQGFSVEQVPWHKEAEVRLPVARWREAIDGHFPGSGWLRLDRTTIAALAEYKSRRIIATWDETLRALLDAAADPASLPGVTL